MTPGFVNVFCLPKMILKIVGIFLIHFILRFVGISKGEKRPADEKDKKRASKYFPENRAEREFISGFGFSSHGNGR